MIAAIPAGDPSQHLSPQRSEATMRTGPALLIMRPLAVFWAVSCAGCAWLQKPVSPPVAQAPAPNQMVAAAPPAPAPAADATPRFECSDGTISVSQTGCLVKRVDEE